MFSDGERQRGDAVTAPLSLEPDTLLKTVEDRRVRATLLDRPTVQPLEGYRAAIESRFGSTPHVDPLDGGTGAAMLILLETPGPSQDQPRFVSHDNPTGTARNLRRFMAQAGLRREQVLLWNVVRWHIHGPDARNRAPRRDETTAGLALLPGFLALLPRLRVAILAGRVAAVARPIVEAKLLPEAVLGMPHPSPTYVCTSPAIPLRIATTLRRAAEILEAD